ncbi:peptidase C65 Otubain-domain-containing protein [Chiua virens]|nr:peptidase C65 Otubain-domain-containing protein [Chiua virens]
MHIPDTSAGAKPQPPSPPRLRSTHLPEDSEGQRVESEPFLRGHPILPEDMDINDLTQAQLYEMNQRLLEESMESERTSALATRNHIDNLTNQGYSVIIRAKGTRHIPRPCRTGNQTFHMTSLALAFAYLDRLVSSPGRNKEDRIAATSGILARAGFDDCVYGEPCEILRDLVKPSGHVNAKDELWQNFTDPSTSNYIVMYMRLLTSAQMRVDEQFADFLFDPDTQMQISVDDFCRRFVEPLGKEADHVQVAALAQALDVHVKVAYLDGHAADGQVNFVDFSENVSGGAKPLVLLISVGRRSCCHIIPGLSRSKR